MTRQRALGRSTLNQTTQDWYSTARVSKRLTDETADCLRARYCISVPMLFWPDLGLNLPGLLLYRDDDEFRRGRCGDREGGCYIYFSKTIMSRRLKALLNTPTERFCSFTQCT